MDPTQKNNSDCYFYYYSTCKKGDVCPFRHEPSALGCEEMCSYWQQNNCMNDHCNFRHMELKKNRKATPCYWETQRSGCTKPHCVFLHMANRSGGKPEAVSSAKATDVNPKPPTQEWSNRPDENKFDGSGTESDQGRGSSEAGSFIGSPAVDPLIVNFDEESDNESITSPAKPGKSWVNNRKSEEQLRLEEIQAATAAFYAVDETKPQPQLLELPRPYKQRRHMMYEQARKRFVYVKVTPPTTPNPISESTPNVQSKAENSTDVSPDFQILTLEEIRQRRRERSRVDESIVTITPTIDEKSSGIEFADCQKDAETTLIQLNEVGAPSAYRKRTFKNSGISPSIDENPRKDNKIAPIKLQRKNKRLSFSDATSTTKTSGDTEETKKNPLDNRPDETIVSSSSENVENMVMESDVKSNDIWAQIDCSLSTQEDDDYVSVEGSDYILRDIDNMLQ